MSIKVYDKSILKESTFSYGDSVKTILLKDYLNLYEMNDKAIVSIHNDITSNRIFCDRIDYLNHDRETGCMAQISNCEIAYLLEPDDLYIRLDEETEIELIKYYEDYGSKVY